MVPGRQPEQRQSGQSDRDPTPGSRSNVASDRKRRSRGPDIEQRGVRREKGRRESLRLGENRYAQRVAPPGPQAEMDDHACHGGPGQRRQERVPPRVITFRSEANPCRNAGAPECACAPEAEFRLQNESNATGQLEAVTRCGQDRRRRGPRPPYFQLFLRVKVKWVTPLGELTPSTS